MNPSTTIPLTQMIVPWTLLGVLVVWTLICAFLALRPLKTEQRQRAETPASAEIFPLLVPRTPLHRFASAPETPVAGLSTASAESNSEMRATPVA